MRPPDRTHGAAHRLEAHGATAAIHPCLDAINQPRIGLIRGVTFEPLKIHHARIVTASWLESYVPSLPVSSENAAYRGTSDPKHLRCAVIRRDQLAFVSAHHTSSHLY